MRSCEELCIQDTQEPPLEVTSGIPASLSPPVSGQEAETTTTLPTPGELQGETTNKLEKMTGHETPELKAQDKSEINSKASNSSWVEQFDTHSQEFYISGMTEDPPIHPDLDLKTS
ncbi:hypothetical protein JTB14_036407 [Gonioctena quinquepunctata]|nr:hypothetical protein JTB14_036407 [Gonioctena quinquepunctata]